MICHDIDNATKVSTFFVVQAPIWAVHNISKAMDPCKINNPQQYSINEVLITQNVIRTKPLLNY